MKIKKGNVFAHAKALGKKVTFKKPAVKRKAAKKPAARKPARKAAVTKKQYKYTLQVKTTTHGLWKSLLGANSLASIKELARMYANNYPAYAFRVM